MTYPQSALFAHDSSSTTLTSNGVSRRVLLYSHDSFGLGHFRRNLAIARALVAQSAHVNVLMISGSPCATQFSLPRRCDVVKLPSVGKNEAGEYVPKNLGISLGETLDLRRQLITAAYRSFDPDVIVVDHQLTGMQGEALPMVRAARESGKLTVFGMRDIVDAAEVVERDWGSAECREVLERDYARIFIYGDRTVFDAISEYPVLQPYRDKIATLGYIAGPVSRNSPRPVPTLEQHVLVTVGGGEDGAERVEAYLEALSLKPANWNSHIITGPLMDEKKVRACKAIVDRSRHSKSIRISRFHSDIPTLMQQADAVVSMAGYNSCAELLRSRKPTVLMPRDKLRHEQRIRAARLAARGLAQSIEKPDPWALRQALEQALSGQAAATDTPNLDGLQNMCRMVNGMAGAHHDVVSH